MFPIELQQQNSWQLLFPHFQILGLIFDSHWLDLTSRWVRSLANHSKEEWPKKETGNPELAQCYSIPWM